MNNLRICYSHVPKCGGISVRRALEKIANPWWEFNRFKYQINLRSTGRMSQIYDMPDLKGREVVLSYGLSNPKAKFIGGHLPCPPIVVNNFCDTWKFVTVLRNPVDRWISAYIYNTYKDKDINWSRNNMPIEEYLNSQTAIRTGRLYMHYFSDELSGISGNGCFESAISNLEKFALVGILENLADFQQRGYKLFGKQLTMQHKNKSPRSNIAETILQNRSFLEKINHYCREDMQIYNYFASKNTHEYHRMHN